MQSRSWTRFYRFSLRGVVGLVLLTTVVAAEFGRAIATQRSQEQLLATIRESRFRVFRVAPIRTGIPTFYG